MPSLVRILSAAIPVLATAVAAAAAIPVANPAWNGTWTADPSQSQSAGRTLSFAKEGAGYRFSNGSFLNYTFACDGKDYPVNFDGYATACKQTGPDSFETADKLKLGGKVMNRNVLTLSDGGKILTDKEADEQPNGKTSLTVTTYQRIAGSPSDGLAGTWKSVKREGTQRTVVYKITGDHVLLTYPNFGESVAAKLDGTPAIFKGPDIPADARETITLETPDRLHLVALHDGKPFVELVDTLNPDGRSFTSVQWAVGKENEKTTSTFHKREPVKH